MKHLTYWGNTKKDARSACGIPKDKIPTVQRSTDPRDTGCPACVATLVGVSATKQAQLNTMLIQRTAEQGVELSKLRRAVAQLPRKR